MCFYHFPCRPLANDVWMMDSVGSSQAQSRVLQEDGLVTRCCDSLLAYGKAQHRAQFAHFRNLLLTVSAVLLGPFKFQLNPILKPVLIKSISVGHSFHLVKQND